MCSGSLLWYKIEKITLKVYSVQFKQEDSEFKDFRADQGTTWITAVWGGSIHLALYYLAWRGITSKTLASGDFRNGSV